jgi:hypothetical protein
MDTMWPVRTQVLRARPDGFESPTTWFEAGDARVKKSQFFQRLTDTPLCY